MNNGAHEMRQQQAELEEDLKRGRRSWPSLKKDELQLLGLERCPNHPNVIGRPEEACPICVMGGY